MTTSTTVTVVVRTMKPEYIAGGTVEGTVTAFVDQVDQRMMSPAAKVVVTVIGVEHASGHANSPPTDNVTTLSRNSFEEEASHHHVFWSCTPLVLEDAIGAGTHSWPFSVVLPKDLPSNMMLMGSREDGTWKVSYGATASFSFGESDPAFYTSAEAEFLVWSNPLPYLTTKPVTVGPDKMRDFVDTRGRIKRGSVSFGFRLSQTAFGRGEVIRVSVACLNIDPMTSHIESVAVELVQEATWSTTASMTGSCSVASSQHQEVLACETIEGEEDVDQSGLLSEPKSKIGAVAGMFSKSKIFGLLSQYSSSASYARKKYIKSMLGSGKGASFAVEVPTETLDTVSPVDENQGSAHKTGYLKLISSLHHFVRVTVRAEETYGSSSQVLTAQHPVKVLHHLAGAEKKPAVAVAMVEVPLVYAPSAYLRGVVVGNDYSSLPIAHGNPAR